MYRGVTMKRIILFVNLTGNGVVSRKRQGSIEGRNARGPRKPPRIVKDDRANVLKPHHRGTSHTDRGPEGQPAKLGDAPAAHMTFQKQEKVSNAPLGGTPRAVDPHTSHLYRKTFRYR